jgi:hypothetical protein
MNLLSKHRLVLIGAVSAIAALSGCATGGGSRDANLPVEVRALEFQPLLVTDDAALRRGDKPVWALLERSPAPSRTWKLLQLSGHSLSPERDNQEVVVLSTDLTNVYPEWQRATFEYRTDPVSGKRSDFRIGGTIHGRRDDYAMPRSERLPGIGYQPSNSAFGTTRVYSVLGSGVTSTWDKWWALNESALRNAVSDTGLLANARAFQAGDKTYAATPNAAAPLAFAGQVWLVTPNDSERDRFYFVPDAFKTASGNVIEIGSSMTVFKSPWSEVTRVKAYATTYLPGYGTLPPRRCGELVVEVIGKKPSKETICGDADGKEWRYAIAAVSPTLGAVQVASVSGHSFATKGVQPGPGLLQLDDANKWDIHVLSSQEAAAVRPLPR